MVGSHAVVVRAEQKGGDASKRIENESEGKSLFRNNLLYLHVCILDKSIDMQMLYIN